MDVLPKLPKLLRSCWRQLSDFTLPTRKKACCCCTVMLAEGLKTCCQDQFSDRRTTVLEKGLKTCCQDRNSDRPVLDCTQILNAAQGPGGSGSSLETTASAESIPSQPDRLQSNPSDAHRLMQGNVSSSNSVWSGALSHNIIL